MDYEQSLLYLEQTIGENQKLSRETVEKIVRLLPFSLKESNFFQVAGTNGKGSVAFFLHNALSKIDKKAGLFISPHLIDVRERIRTFQGLITKTDFAKAISFVQDFCSSLLQKGEIEGMPTYFEHLFLAALYYFFQQKSRYVVLEVGLGGRLDATSTVFSRFGVITKIAADHQNILGKSLLQIAAEKAGIMKPGMIVITGVSAKSRVGQVILQRAKESSCQLIFTFDKDNRLVYNSSGWMYCTKNDCYPLNLKMAGKHQLFNAALAIKTLEEYTLLNRCGLKREEIIQAIEQTVIPGRQEIFSEKPLLIFDVAHNPDGVRALAETLRIKNLRNGRLVFGVLADKDYRKMVQILDPFFKEIVLLDPHSWRALRREKLIPLFKEKKVILPDSYQQAAELISNQPKDTVVCGSFFLVGNMRKLFTGGLNGN